MIKRWTTRLQQHPEAVYIVEAALVGLFFIQSLRFMIGSVYARIGSASQYPALNPANIDPTLPGLVSPETLNSELTLLVFMLFVPLLALLMGRTALGLMLAAWFTAGARYAMLAFAPDADLPFTLVVGDLSAAGVTFGAALLYITTLIQQRARLFPVMMLLALGLDQLYRAAGDTLDISWSSSYENAQLVLSLLLVAVALVAWLISRRQRVQAEDSISPDRGLLTHWGGLSFGALLFLQLALLALPNAVARRADLAYTPLVPALIAATLLPLIPWVRAQARRFISMFDSSVRGWVWMLLVMLLLVIGTRLSGLVAGAALVAAQVMVSLIWWWLFRPQAQRERNLSGLWLILGVGVFVTLTTFDVFTYEYAFVRDFSAELDFLNPIVPPLLRGFRGLGLAVLLLGVLLSVVVVVQTRRRIAWTGGDAIQSLLMTIVVVAFSVLAAFLARPPVVTGLTNPDVVRIGTYNIHGGYNEFYFWDLEMMARTIEFSGAGVVLLQEVEAGRMTSFGVDQPLWLARRLGMDVRFLPTNEGLQGLAVLSRLEIVAHDGTELSSQGVQTGLQRVIVRPDDDEIVLYNTWLEPLLDAGDAQTIAELEQSQQQQLTEVLVAINTFADDDIGRTVLGGTFNNIPSSDIILTLTETVGFVDHFSDLPPALAVTFQRTGVAARLDYLWTTQVRGFQVVESAVINDLGREVLARQASDHLIAVIALDLR